MSGSWQDWAALVAVIAAAWFLVRSLCRNRKAPACCSAAGSPCAAQSQGKPLVQITNGNSKCAEGCGQCAEASPRK